MSAKPQAANRAESGRPWLTWFGGQPAIVNGMIDAPTRPGFGAVFEVF